jgi:hypothetical protein
MRSSTYSSNRVELQPHQQSCAALEASNNPLKPRINTYKTNTINHLTLPIIMKATKNEIYL